MSIYTVLYFNIVLLRVFTIIIIFINEQVELVVKDLGL